MSTVSINLLPEVRLNRLKAARQKQLSISLMFLVVAICGGILVVGILVLQAQNFKIKTLDKSITDHQTQLSQTSDLQNILTVQSHLASLGTLYSQRVYLSHFFSILQQVSPSDVSIKSLSLDETNAITINGSTSSYLAASRLARAMEVSGIDINPNVDKKADFTDVQLSGLTSGGTGKVTFSIKASASEGVINASK